MHSGARSCGLLGWNTFDEHSCGLQMKLMIVLWSQPLRQQYCMHTTSSLVCILIHTKLQTKRGTQHADETLIGVELYVRRLPACFCVQAYMMVLANDW